MLIKKINTTLSGPEGKATVCETVETSSTLVLTTSSVRLMEKDATLSGWRLWVRVPYRAQGENNVNDYKRKV